MEVSNHVGSPGDGHYPSCPHASTCPHCGAPKAAPYHPDWTYRPYRYGYYPSYWNQSGTAVQPFTFWNVTS